MEKNLKRKCDIFLLREVKMKKLQKKAKIKKTSSFSSLFKHYFFRLKSFKGLRNFCFFLFVESLFGCLVKFLFRSKKNFIGKTNIVLFLKRRYIWLILPIEEYDDLIKFLLRRKKNFIGKMNLFLKRRYIWLILLIKDYRYLVKFLFKRIYLCLILSIEGYKDCEWLNFEEV